MNISATFAQAAPACPARKVKVAWVATENWRSHEIIQTSTGGKLPIADCVTSIAQARLEAGSIALVEDFNRLNCNGTGNAPAGIAELDLPEGVCASYTTEAVYRDVLGNMSLVTIPELGAPLAPHQTATFDAIESDGERSTFLAIFPATAGSTRVQIRTVNGKGAPAGEETITVSGFTFYELTAQVRIGSMTVENRGSQIGPESGVAVEVIVFTGYRAGGGPRVIQPNRSE